MDFIHRLKQDILKIQNHDISNTGSVFVILDTGGQPWHLTTGYI